MYAACEEGQVPVCRGAEAGVVGVNPLCMMGGTYAGWTGRDKRAKITIKKKRSKYRESPTRTGNLSW